MKKWARKIARTFSLKWFLPLLTWGVSCTPAQSVFTEAEPVADSAIMVQPAGTSCAHSLCKAGTKLTPSCDPCVQKICTADPYCCKTGWNSICIGEVSSICGQSCTSMPDMSHGTPDLGGGKDGGAGGVGPTGGAVDHLYFAVVGDTRPPAINSLADYPTAIIQKIYADIEGMSPRPQFVLGTGDYMFASTTGTQAATQLGLYADAMRAFTGPVFAAMGNHECDGYTATNCVGKTTANLTAYMNMLVTPLGKSQPYYTIPIRATSGTWSAKVLILACNQWDGTQKSWLTTELAKPTTYTIVVRHEPASDPRGPCVNDVESLLAAYPYNLSIVGHTHHFQLSGKELLVGNGGAPLSGGTYGYATVEQLPTGFRVSNYDYATAAALSSVTVPF